MRTVVVVSVGGTIASTADAGGVKRAAVSGAELVSKVVAPAEVRIRISEAAQVNSFAMDFGDIDTVNGAVQSALDDPSTCGVVVTHGTDTLEETAMALELCHRDQRPVVFTGAQRSWDDPATDALTNVRDAVTVAVAPQARGRGVLVCFGGVLHAAAGTRKVHTSSLNAFADADRGPIGTVNGSSVQVHTDPPRSHYGLSALPVLSGTRVDTVAIYPGVDRTAIDAYVTAGAHGIVLEATGCGNANAHIVGAVRDLSDRSIPVVLSSRVQAGPIAAIYGAGGGADLVAVGAIPAGQLRPSQARVLLASLIASKATASQIRTAFTSLRL